MWFILLLLWFVIYKANQKHLGSQPFITGVLIKEMKKYQKLVKEDSVLKEFLKSIKRRCCFVLSYKNYVAIVKR